MEPKAGSGTATGSRTMAEMFSRRVERSTSRAALRHKSDGAWKTLSWTDWDRAAREVAAGLVDLGVEIGDRVAIAAQTRLEWVVCDVGAVLAGAITVPIYPSSLPDQFEHILRDSGATLVLAEDPHQLDKLLEIRSSLSQVRCVVLMSDRAELERPDRLGRTRVTLEDVLPAGSLGRDWVLSYDDLRARGRQLLEDRPDRLAQVAASLDPQQAATIIYTSGTTGAPKGVVLTHANIVFQCAAVEDLLGLGDDDEHLLFLPLAHSFARSTLWSVVALGACTAIAEGLTKVIDNLREIRPTFMTSVPRVFEKAYSKIQAGFAEKRRKPVTRYLVDWAMAQGVERARRRPRPGAPNGLRILLADKLVFHKVQQTFGGRMKYFVSGGAPLAPEISEFFHAAGLPILEGYGLTETCAAATCNRPGDVRFGTVGPPLEGIEVKIAPDGEVFIRGGNVMQGYHGQPQATAEAIDPDGWFRSGDIGTFDGGHLRITDRKKDIIVTAGGKNVAPQNLENTFKSLCPLASQIVVIGDRRNYLVALVTLNEEALVDWAAGRGLGAGGRPLPEWLADMARRREVEQEIQSSMDRMNRALPSYEAVKRFAILPADFTQESGELTPSLKVKRKLCMEKYRAEIDSLYAAADPLSRQGGPRAADAGRSA